ncbi:MAG: hypothetical protein KJN81_05265 [Acidimicrobiia bacterium]|nr:hypothetical protein [Acidimicrobiia bacterium]NNL27822.1 hypothetical protein [Acidimicrobiia bacterium]
MGVVILLALGASPSSAQTSAPSISEDAVYEVDAETGVIQVERAFRVDRASGVGSIQVPVDASSENVTVQGGNRTVSLSVAGGEDYAYVTIPASVLTGADAVLRYDIVGNPNRSKSPGRVNPALSAWEITVVGSPGKSNVEILVPRPYRPEWAGTNSVAYIDKTDRVEIKVSRINNPTDFVLAVAARDDRKLDVREFNIDGNFVRLHFWPGDDEWADFVEDNARLALPVLRERIGRPWPEVDTLDIIESPRPYLIGYGGWYAINLGEIEVGELLLTSTLIHELTHAWFNDSLFQERFITEGLADTFARQAALSLLEGDIAPEVREAMEETLEVPEQPDLDSTVARPLLDWSSSAFGSFDIERYGYQTSFYLVNELYEEIGPDAFAEMLVAADLDYTAYPASDPTETVFVAANWRRFFDLAERIGGSEQAEDLFRSYVLREEDAALLDERSAAIEAYEAFVLRSRPYDVPINVRDALNAWAFDAALERIDEADAALSDLLALDARAAASDFDLPIDLTQEYYAGDFDRIAPTLEVYSRALDRLDEVAPLRERSLSWLETAGLGDTDINYYFDLATARINNGNPLGAIEAADQAVEQFSGLGAAGLRTIGLRAVIGAVLLALAGFAIRLGIALARRRSSPTLRLDALEGGDDESIDRVA